MNHGDDGFHLFHFVPLKPLKGELVLVSCRYTLNNAEYCFTNDLKYCRRVVYLVTIERADVPCNVVAPADGLNPVNSSGVYPHQISRPLNEAVHWDV